MGRPLHHGGDPAASVDVDGDAGVPGAVPTVGAEVAAEVAQADVAMVGRVQPLDPPHPRGGGAQRVGLVAVELGGAAATVAGRRLLDREGEVAAVGGVLEEDECVPLVRPDQMLHPPHRVQGWDGSVRAQGDPRPVPVGVDVRSSRAALQPHEGPVGEQLHRLVMEVLVGRTVAFGRHAETGGLFKRRQFVDNPHPPPVCMYSMSALY